VVSLIAAGTAGEQQAPLSAKVASPTNERSERGAVLSRRPTYLEEMAGPKDAGKGGQSGNPRALRRRCLTWQQNHTIWERRGAPHGRKTLLNPSYIVV